MYSRKSVVILRNWTKATGDGKDVFPLRKGQSLVFLWHNAILTGAPARSQCVEGMSCPAAPFSLLPWLLRHTGSPRETLEALPHLVPASLSREFPFCLQHVSVDERTGGRVSACRHGPSSMPVAKSLLGISLTQESLLPPQEHLNPVPGLLVPQPPVSVRNMVLTYPQFANEETGTPRAKHLAQNHSTS